VVKNGELYGEREIFETGKSTVGFINL